MKRIVWVGVALLVMVAILGYGILTMRNIEEVNKRRREMNAGKQDAVVIIATEATTSVWDKLHAQDESGDNGNKSETFVINADTIPEGFQTDPPADGEAVQSEEDPVEQKAAETSIVIRP